MEPDRKINEESGAVRETECEITPLLLNRWSARAMSGEPLSDDELMPLFEAARWAPSSNNGQPWRFVIARRQNPADFERMLGLLAASNQTWANRAACLALVASRTRHEQNNALSLTHAFDTGAACENLSLEAAGRGLVVHMMAGFDHERSKIELQIPGDFEVHAVIAIGKPGRIEDLPERYQAREKPSTRRPLREVVFEGIFGAPLHGK